MRAGKHVLVEKSISLTLKDADRMLAEAKKAKRHLMVAHVLPFFPEFAFARRVIQSRKFGQLLGAHFKRVISKPTWSADIASLEKTGGPAVDLHIHDTHFIGLVCGVPHQVYARGLSERGYVTYLTTHYIYDSAQPTVTCSSGAICQPGRPFVHGFEIYFEKGTLLFESGTQPLVVLTPDGKVTQPKLGSGDPIVAFTSELQHALQVISKGVDEAELSGELARNALLLCHKETQSVLTGKPVRVQ
jgi:predicted dehydrogenase